MSLKYRMPPAIDANQKHQQDEQRPPGQIESHRESGESRKGDCNASDCGGNTASEGYCTDPSGEAPIEALRPAVQRHSKTEK